MAFNSLPLELLPLIIEAPPLPSLYSLFRTCRSLNSKLLTAALTSAIDVYFAPFHQSILSRAASRTGAAIMRRYLDIESLSGFLNLLAPGASGEAVQAASNYGPR